MRGNKAGQRWSGRAVRALRTRLELTQEQFAAIIPTAVGEVSRWEHEHHVPSRLAQRRLDDLARGDG